MNLSNSSNLARFKVHIGKTRMSEIQNARPLLDSSFIRRFQFEFRGSRLDCVSFFDLMLTFSSISTKQSNQSAQELADERARMRTEILERNPNIDDVNLVVTLVTEEGTVNSILFHRCQ